MADEVLTEVRGRVLIITLNRPEVRNAIDTALGQGVIDAYRRLDDDDDLTVAVLTGAGKGFCSGMDLKAFASGDSSAKVREVLQGGAAKPVVVAIEGFAVAGGLELALTGDLLVGASDARFGIPEVGVGLVAGGGGLYRLHRRVPWGVATEMALTGEPISAPEAHRHRLIDRMCEPGDALEVAVELAETVAANAPMAVRVSKTVMNRGWGLPEDEYWAMQAPVVAPVFASADAIEGATAFAEKRPPRWSGR